MEQGHAARAHDAKPAIVRVSSTSAWNHPDLSLLRDGGGRDTSRGIRSSEAESETVQIVKKLRTQLQGCQQHLQELERSHRAQEKVDKYQAGYAAQDMRRAFLPAVVSTSGRIHGEILRLLYLLADNKLACAQATILCSQVFGKANPRAGRPRA